MHVGTSAHFLVCHIVLSRIKLKRLIRLVYVDSLNFFMHVCRIFFVQCT